MAWTHVNFYPSIVMSCSIPRRSGRFLNRSYGEYKVSSPMHKNGSGFKVFETKENQFWKCIYFANYFIVRVGGVVNYNGEA